MYLLVLFWLMLEELAYVQQISVTETKDKDIKKNKV